MRGERASRGPHEDNDTVGAIMKRHRIETVLRDFGLPRRVGDVLTLHGGVISPCGWLIETRLGRLEVLSIGCDQINMRFVSLPVASGVEWPIELDGRCQLAAQIEGRTTPSEIVVELSGLLRRFRCGLDVIAPARGAQTGKSILLTREERDFLRELVAPVRAIPTAASIEKKLAGL